MIVYRASELGSCTRRLVLSRVGYDPKSPPPKYVEYFAAGDATEIEVKTDLRAAGWTIEREQEEVIVDITDEIKIVGHIDGVGIESFLMGPYRHGTRLLEIKRMNPTYWNYVKATGWIADGLMEKYRWQISAYMEGTGLEATLVARNGETGEDLFLYAEEPFYSHNDLAARVLVIEGRARSFTTLDFPCDQADYPCPFFYTHADDREDADADEAEEIEGLGLAYQLAKARERDAKETAERCRDELSGMLGERRKVNAGRVRVTKFDTTRTRFDKKRAIDDGVDVAKYESPSTSTSVRISVREELENHDEQEGQ